MKPNQFIKEIKNQFKEIEALGFIGEDELKASDFNATVDRDNVEGLVMRLYFLATDPEKDIKYFINQYAESKFLYLMKLSDSTWFFVMCKDNNFVKLHFFIKYFLEDIELDYSTSKILSEESQEFDDKLSSAKRIQEILLPDMAKATGSFSEKYYWLKSKDKVGGDFFWTNKTKTHQWFVVGDCTGHSVEGALASVSVMSLLNQVFDAEMNPHHLIKELHQCLNDMQNQNIHEGYGIGCELMVIKIDLKKKELKYSGTGLPLYVTGDKVKYNRTKTASFNPERIIKFIRSRNIKLKDGEGIFTHSDGLTDQMNAQGKRIRRQEILSQVEKHKVINGEVIEKFVTEWKGDQEQTDDISCLYLKP